MSDAGLCSLSALELRAGYVARDFTPVEVLDALAARIAEREASVNAFITVDLDRARAEALSAAAEYAAGAPRPLAGLPVAVKDLIDTAGLRTTYGSAMFADHVPARDATVVRRVRDAGGIVIGKTLTHEFAWGITSANPHYGPCRNPWGLDRVAGGSSGGSAAAVACGEAPLALGSDTGGSIRIPAAFCGVVGMKPTYGRVSVAGVFPLAPSLDHAGPLARTPADARLLLDAIAGVDPADAATALQPVMDAPAEAGGLRVAVCPDLHPVEPAAAVQRAFEAAASALEELGAEVVEVTAPAGRDALAVFASIQLGEALHVHREAGLFPARADEYGADVRARLELATEVGLADYLSALAARRRLCADLAAIFRRADVLLTPVAAGPPIRIGEDAVEHLGRTLSFRELVMGFTVPQDLAGVPACTLPAGRDDHGIPIGVQLTASWWRERKLLNVAEALAGALAVSPS